MLVKPTSSILSTDTTVVTTVVNYISVQICNPKNSRLATRTLLFKRQVTQRVLVGRILQSSTPWLVESGGVLRVARAQPRAREPVTTEVSWYCTSTWRWVGRDWWDIVISALQTWAIIQQTCKENLIPSGISMHVQYVHSCAASVWGQRLTFEVLIWN